jgi:hypothetical protein
LIKKNEREVDMSGYIVKANAQEAMLVDWILTLHTSDSDYFGYLMKPSIQKLRYQSGRIIVNGGGELELLEEEIRWLLTILPATFRLGKEDVGFSLKNKLRKEYLSKKSRVRSILVNVTGFLSTRRRLSHKTEQN